jgi:methylenetetrahydrofolate reductase (NADPH)
MCGAHIPDQMLRDLDPIAAEAEAVHEYGIAWSTRQCRELLQRGVDGLHFYTLNRSKSSRQIVENLRASGALE